MLRHFALRPNHLARIFALAAFCLVLASSVTAAVHSKVEGESLIAARPLEPSSYELYAKFLRSQGAYEEAAAILEKGRTKAVPSAS